MMAVTMGVTVIVQKQLKICMSDLSVTKMGIEGAIILMLGVICGATSKSLHDIAIIALIQAVYFFR
jgi:hypothetical protein